MLSVDAGEEVDVGHGILDIFAFQESLLIQAVFTIVILAMVGVGFRRWLQYKEKMARLIAERTAERVAQYGARIEQVEARLKAVEQIVTDGSASTVAQIDTISSNPLPEPKAGAPATE
jgi:hypothetical protein